MKKFLIEKDTYFDSVFLMLINKEIKNAEGIREAVVSMGTEVNRELLAGIGLSGPETDAATSNDLIIALDAESGENAAAALGKVKELLTKKRKTGGNSEYKPGSLDGAVKTLPDANLVIISLPGEYAANEAAKAIRNNLNVMMFSDNVTVEEEIFLKNLAAEQGVLMMGPDCGTAIINGCPLCFANVVARGDIGIVAASGTGLQEVSSIIDRSGCGITQAIGTGGRDLKESGIGGKMMLMGIEALKNDPETRVIVIISKPPSGEIAEKVINALKETGKPGVVHFIGGKEQKNTDKLIYAANLEEAAGTAVSLSKNIPYKPSDFTLPDDQINTIVQNQSERISAGQKYLRGLYTGGTLADETLYLLTKNGFRIYSNNHKDPELKLGDPERSVEHSIVDLGDDVYTVGRPHPMIDPSIREERILTEAEDPEAAVMILDIVLGYGSHSDPAEIRSD